MVKSFFLEYLNLGLQNTVQNTRAIERLALGAPFRFALWLKSLFSLFQLVAHILDRNVCLLPAYLAVNEINKVCPEDRKWPHWVWFIVV